MRRLDDRGSGGAPCCARASTRQRPGHRVAPPGRLHGQGTPGGAGPLHLRGARRDGSHRAADAAPTRRWTDEHDRVLHPRGGRASGPSGLGTSPACLRVGRRPLGPRRSGWDGEEGSRHHRDLLAGTGGQGAGNRPSPRPLRRSGRADDVRGRPPERRPGSTSAATRRSPPSCGPHPWASDIAASGPLGAGRSTDLEHLLEQGFPRQRCPSRTSRRRSWRRLSPLRPRAARCPHPGRSSGRP